MISAWDKEIPTPKALDFLTDLGTHIAREGGDVGARISDLISQRDWAAICRFTIDYNMDWDVNQLIACRQSLALFQKLDFLPVGVNKTDACLQKFLQSESECEKSNWFFRTFHGNPGYCPLPFGVRLVESVRRQVRRVLGPAPDISELTLTFGPGATTAVKRNNACACHKFASGIQCSPNLFHSDFLAPLLESLPHWAIALEDDDIKEGCELNVRFPTDVAVHHAKLGFVPKTALTHRSVLVEPNLNGLLQKGIGEYMARRLRLFGVDIRDQTRNQRLAQQGSLSNELCTIDLSSASDTISYEFVKLVLDDDWFALLAASRSCSAILPDGSVIHLQKFSSMGNGFTFPLETLLFWCVTKAALLSQDGVVGIYGDDIICPSWAYDDVVRALQFCGFTVNTGKSFCDGPFRESCGADYYLGMDIRPVYLRHQIDGRSLFVLHNGFYRRGRLDWAERVLRIIPEHLRLFGPDGYGDGHLLGTFVKQHKRAELRKGYSGYRFDSFVDIGRRVRTRFPGDWVSPLYTIYATGRVQPDWYSVKLPCNRSSGSLEELTPTKFAPDGRPEWTLPGSEGYKRISIYTLG